MTDTPLFDVDPDIYKMHDWMLRCTNETTTGEILDYIFQDIPVDIKRTAAKAFFGVKIKTKTKTIINKTGGNGEINKIIEFMAFLDTCHDFAEDLSAVTSIQHTLNVTIPKYFQLGNSLKEADAIRWISRQKFMDFSGSKVSNPMYKANILQRFDASNFNGNFEDLCKKQQQHYHGKMGSGVAYLPIDVFTTFHQPPHTSKQEHLKLIQVCELCYNMRKLYGQAAEFQVDATSDQLVLLVVATKFISTNLTRRFTTDPTLQIKDIDGYLSNVEWSTRLSDANVFDAAVNNTNIPIDKRATKEIFMTGSGSLQIPQITLNGFLSSGDGVMVTFMDGSTNVTLPVTNKDATKMFSVNSISLLIDVTSANKAPRNLKDHLIGFSNPMKYAIKRAGDWGQVAHCKKYKKVFVTSDLMAAMYAISQNVRCILLRRKEHTAIIQYTFVLC